MDWLKEIRLNKGVSQKETAEAVGIAQATYCNIETGKRGLTVETAKRIADYFGFTWTKFFDGES